MKRKHRFMKPFKNSSQGMTLIEIVLVMALIIGLMTVVIIQIDTNLKRGREDQTRMTFEVIKQKMMLYRVDNGTYPKTEEGLEALISKPAGASKWRGPYLEDESILDAWRQPISYSRSAKGFCLESAGDDGEAGNGDDIRMGCKS